MVAALVLATACSSDDAAPLASGRAAVTTTTSEPQATTSSSTSTAPAVPLFAAAVSPVTADDLPASWRPGCPVPVSALRAVDATYWGFDGQVHDGRLIVAAEQAEAVRAVLEALFAARYPIERMEPVDVYGGSDAASMDANNTSGFNCRPATGSTSWSAHAYGRAIDLNPLQNPYVKGDTVLPPQSAHLVDRSRTHRGMIHAGDPAVTAFAAQGWEWGGDRTTLKDYQHFQVR